MAQGATAKLSGATQRGVVVKFDDQRGYGFIRPDGANGQGDVFVHIRDVSNARSLHPGQRVSYRLTRSDKGLAAVNVQAGSMFTIPYVGYLALGIAGAVLLFGLGALLLRPSTVATWLVLWVVALSFATFGVYRYDKGQAEAGRGRVPEAVLLLLAALGGSPGAFAGMHMPPRHKTSKPSFQAVYWLIVAAQVAGLLFLLLRR